MVRRRAGRQENRITAHDLEAKMTALVEEAKDAALTRDEVGCALDACQILIDDLSFASEGEDKEPEPR